MNMEQKVLFGVDDSDFARQAIAAIGHLLKDNENCKITIFYCAPDPDLTFLTRILQKYPEALEEYEKICRLEEHNVVDRARDALAESGVTDDRLAVVCEGKCRDPSDALLELASKEGCETLAVGRRGPDRVERKFIGTLAYQLVHTAENRPLWVIDPRVSSHDVLIAVVGAPISRRVVEHTVKYFGHLRERRFTFFHVLPPLPPQYWDDARILNEKERKDREKTIKQWMNGYVEEVEKIANEGKEKLIKVGIPEENITLKVQAQDKGIARDILAELEGGGYGILVLGRKGFKSINQFGLGSKANKLLLSAHALAVCLVN